MLFPALLLLHSFKLLTLQNIIHLRVSHTREIQIKSDGFLQAVI